MGRLAARNNVEVIKVDRIVENFILTNVYAIDTNFQKGNDRMLTTAGHLLQTPNVLLFIVLLWFCCQRRTRDDPRNPMDLCMLRLTGRIRRIQRWTGRYESPENVVESEGNRGRERGENRKTVVVRMLWW